MELHRPGLPNIVKTTVLGISPERMLHFGADSSVYRRGPFAVKVYDRPGAQGFTIYGIRSYRHETGKAKKVIDNRKITFETESGEKRRTVFRVNPVLAVGMVNHHPFSISPYIQGLNLAHYLSAHAGEFNDLDPELVKIFYPGASERVRYSLRVFCADLREQEGLTRINITSNNVIPVLRDGRITLVVTDVRAHVAPGSNVLRTAFLSGLHR